MPFHAAVPFFLFVISSIAPAHAAESVYPNRPIRAVVASAPGGGLDASTRILSPRLSESMEQTWVPAKTLAELITLARQKPGALNYASAALCTAIHLGAELLKFRAAAMAGQNPPWESPIPWSETTSA